MSNTDVDALPGRHEQKLKSAEVATRESTATTKTEGAVDPRTGGSPRYRILGASFPYNAAGVGSMRR